MVYFHRNIGRSLKVIFKHFYLLTFLFASCDFNKDNKTSTQEHSPCTQEYGICIDSLDVAEYKIKSGENFSLIFSNLGFSSNQINKIQDACSDEINFKRIIAGNSYNVYTSRDSVAAVQYVVFTNSATSFSVINLSSDSAILSYSYDKPITTKKMYTEGTLTSSLWNSLVENKTNPLLALKLSDVFGWQIDFFDLRKGDSYKILYEEMYIDDSVALSIGAIKGAVFNHKNKEYYAIPFRQNDVVEYFDTDGNSLRKAFLKAPLDYYRITSRFTNSRYHPVLKRYRAHHGVDYAAPIGTPVRTIGDGVVTNRGFQKGGGGNYIKVKHNATYSTTYMHLKGFASGLKVGSHVQQGQVIGYVGSSGLSTGPHLDFRVYKNGKAIDPLKMESPPSVPVQKELMPEFQEIKKQIIDEINMISHFKKVYGR